jgi:putative intracellular protease/amidase
MMTIAHLRRWSLLVAAAFTFALFLVGCMVGSPTAEEGEEDGNSETSEAALGHGANIRRPVRPAKVLIVLSAADFIWVQEKDTGRVRKTPAGYFLSELGFPLARLLETGAEITFASPNGGRPTMDRVSDSPSLLYYRSSAEYRALRELVTSQQGMQNPQVLEDITDEALAGFDALFIPGGHAPMTDLAKSPAMERVLLHFHTNLKPTASLCHGPAAFLSAKSASQPFPYAGYRMTALSDSEEQFQEFMNVYDTNVRLTWYVERDLTAAGARYERNLIKFTSRVVSDRELVTGQNPQSARALGTTFAAKVTDYVDAQPR